MSDLLFDNKFVKNDLGKSDEEKVREKLNIIDMKKELTGLDQSAQGGVVLGSPISYLYDRFSKAGKERTKYAMLVEQDKLAAISRKQFDDLTVTTLTNYTDEELEKFLKSIFKTGKIDLYMCGHDHNKQLIINCN